MTRRALLAPVLGLAMAVSLLAPALMAPTPAEAAKGKKAPNAWAAYLWPAGMSCTYDDARPDGTTQGRIRVAKRSATMVKIRWNGGGTQAWSLAAGGRMEQPDRYKRGATTNVVHQAYPTVSQVRAKRGETTLTVKRIVKYSAKGAKGFLKKGRTMTVTGMYRVKGLGTKTLALPEGSVSAIGVGVKLRSITVENLRKEHVGSVKDFYRPGMKAVEGDEWWAKGRGVVRWTFDGGRGSSTQRSCS